MNHQKVHQLIVESGIGERIRLHLSIRDGLHCSIEQLSFSFEADESGENHDTIVVEYPNPHRSNPLRQPPHERRRFALWPNGAIGYYSDRPMTKEQQWVIKRIRLAHEVKKVLVVFETLSSIPTDEQIDVSQEELTQLEKGYQNLRKRLGLSE